MPSAVGTNSIDLLNHAHGIIQQNRNPTEIEHFLEKHEHKKPSQKLFEFLENIVHWLQETTCTSTM